jgi:hypothetical protein
MSQTNVEIDAGEIGRRFITEHLTEFSAWRLHVNPTRVFKLRWPEGSSGASTLEIGYQVLGRGTSQPRIQLKLVNPADSETLHAYLCALGRAERDYVQRALKEAAANSQELVK